MKNKYFCKIFIIIFFLFYSNLSANDDFIFNSSEVEILKEGTIFKGKKRGTIKTNNGNVIIDADEFTYYKNLNKVNAKGNVKLNDILNDTIILAEDITYLRNKDYIFTNGKTNSIIQKKYKFQSSNVSYNRRSKIFKSNEWSIIYDDNSNKYELENFTYDVFKKLLKGKNVVVQTNYLNEDSDIINFKTGFFDFKNKKFLADKTEVNLHKTLFDKERKKFIIFENPKLTELFRDYYEENEPRISGISSFGNENETIINKGIFTACKKTDDCPPWSMHAKKIKHDKTKKKIIYDHSVLNIYDIPVFYFPKFFHPDPTVKRLSGFLQPKLNNSKILGSSFQIPYFKVIDENVDLTLKPTLFDSDIKMFQIEYRQENKDSSFISDIGTTSGYRSSIDKTNANSLNHLFAKFSKRLELKKFNKSELSIFAEKVNNDNYLKLFENNLTNTPLKPNGYSSLYSGIKLELDHEDYNFTSGMNIYETLSGNNSDRYQYVLPYYNYSKSFNDNFTGTINFYSTGSNVLQNTNNLRTSNVNDINYLSEDLITRYGFINNFGVYLKNLNSIGKNDSIYKSSLSIDGMNIYEISSALPLIKVDNNRNNILTPKISLRYNLTDMNNFSSTSRYVNAKNIFDINRLGLNDAFESGRSITMGVDFRNENIENNEKYLDIKIGTVLRDKVETSIPTTSTLNRKTSNIFGSITNNHYDFVKLEYDFAIDNNFKNFEYNSIGVDFSYNNFVTEFLFIEKNGEMGSTNSIENTSSVKFDKNNYFTFNTRRNREINLTEYYDLVYEYKNDCLTAGITYRKTYYNDREIKPSEDLMLTLSLFPLTILEQKVDQNFYRN